jgi:N-sulfoglucosamine sulfohydrolase
MTPAQPNVVLIVSDDHGLESGCYGNEVVRTPHMDALAADGVRFTQAFCTAATCSASRSVILSGVYSHANGQYGHAHSYHHFHCFDTYKTLSARLGEAGYRTARVGKFHVAPDRVFPFDEVIEVATNRNPVDMAEKSRALIEADGPFFLYFCTGDPHRLGEGREDLPLKPNGFGNRREGYPGVAETTYRPEEVVVPPFVSDTPGSRAELAQDYRSVSRVDTGIGRLVEILKAAGKYENTLVIYVSDNGSAFPASKTTLYEPGMRLPCLVHSPVHAARGTTCDALINWADLAPTILDICGVGFEAAAFHGRSFKDVVDAEHAEGWDETYGSHTFHEVTMYYPMRVVRTRRHKFIWNIAHRLGYPHASDLWSSASCRSVEKYGLEHFGARSVAAYLQRPRFELYDLEADPNEVNDLAADPAYAELVEAFCRKIKAFQERTDDPWVVKWIHE